jgi:hypothetical protein
LDGEKTNFLLKLSFSTLLCLFARINPTGGNLQQVASNGSAILPHENNVAFVIEGNHCHCATVLDNLTFDGLTVSQPNVIHAQVDDVTLINPAAAYQVIVLLTHALPRIVTP